jgi:hypothetical protein
MRHKRRGRNSIHDRYKICVSRGCVNCFYALGAKPFSSNPTAGMLKEGAMDV